MKMRRKDKKELENLFYFVIVPKMQRNHINSIIIIIILFVLNFSFNVQQEKPFFSLFRLDFYQNSI